jgi:uncharacterized protein YjbJ (UPF0337 family)
MNKDQIRGRANEVAGKARQAVADVTGNPRRQRAGEAQEIKGKVQKTVGDLKHKAGKAIDR